MSHHIKNTLLINVNLFFMSVKKIRKVMAHLEKIQCEHTNTLHILEREKKLKCDHLKAAQVRKENLLKVIPLVPKNKLLSQVYSVVV